MLYDSDAMRRFAGIELGDDRIPDETTILNFRHLLEKHQLTEKLFAEVNGHLADQGITLRSGTLVDATIIDAPSSTKNEAKARDPEMSSTKKGNDWYFGMKAHVGVDADSGIVHSLETTTAKVHDSQVWDELLHGGETSVWADKGYVSAAREAAFSGPGKFWGVMRKAPKGGALHPIDEDINRIIAMVGPGSNIPSGCSSGSSGISRPAIAASPRTERSCSRCSRSATCFWCDGG
jgi:IS5 family transposase